MVVGSSPTLGAMSNENLHINGWKAAEQFSIETFKLKMENKELKRKIIEMEAEIQRLSQLARY